VVVGQLGAGGMGEVYRAHDTRLGRDVAVKVLPATLSSDAARMRRFEQEARSAAALNHPNIMAVFDVGSDGGAPYLVTELLEGESLRERLRDGGLPVREAIGIGVQVARGLAAAHGKGIVHRDLKPDNLFLTRDGTVKILDFGLAKLTRPEQAPEAEAPTVSASLTEAGKVLGTVGYMAPEQVRGLEVDQRTDLFAFGCVLYEMLTGRRAFEGATAADTMSAILREAPPPMTAAGVAVPAALETLVERCLAKRAEERFSSAHDLALALEAALAEAGSGPSVRPARAGRRRVPWRTAGGIATAALLGAAAVWLGLRLAGGRATGGLDPRTVLVAPFANLSPDASAPPVSLMAAEAVSRGLLETGLVRVVTLPATVAEGGTDEELRAAARREEAGLLVAGSTYLADGQLELRTRLVDTATGKLVYALEPASGLLGETAEVVDAAAQRVMGAVSVHLDPPLGLGPVVRPPPFRALSEYRAGMSASAVSWAEASRHCA
jgi:TolB-like protein